MRAWRKNSNHGRNLVERSLAYLAAAKNGLAEDELLDILSHDIEVYRSFLEKMRHVPGDLARAVIAYLGEKNCAKYKVCDTSSAEAWYETIIKPDAKEFQKFLEYLSQMPDSPRLPVVLWSRMYFDLKPYLLQRDADGSLLFNYYHRLFGEVATTDYLQSEQGISRHLDLARYFHQSPIRITREGRRTLNKRKMAELLHHQTLAKTWADLEHNLTDILFIEGMFEAGLGTELRDEYNLLRQMGLFPCETGQPREIIVTACEDGGRFGMLCPHCLGISRISPTAVGEMTDCPQCGEKIKLSDTWRSLPWKEQPSKRRYQENAQEKSTPFTQDLVEFAAFVEAEAGHLSSFPTMTLQQAINQPDLSTPAQKARAYIGTGKCEFAWCEHLNKPQSLHTNLPGMPEGIHFSPDGKTWLRLDRGDVVLYQAGSNEIANRFHTGDRPITAVCFSADSEYILARL